jgi:hypothetical protein
MVDIDEDRYYVVDHFAVNGGEQHDQSWHGPMVTPQPPDLDWQARPGTLAGPDVPQFGKWTDKWGRSRKDFPCYVKEIRTVKLTEPAAWTWPTGLKEGDTLRMHLVPIGGALQLSMGKGRSPSRPTDWSLDYLMARHQVKRGRASQFVTVIESYQKKPVIKAVRLISQVPAVIEVDYEGGTDRIEINVPLRASNTTTPQKLGVRVTRPRGDVRVGHCTQGPGAAKSQIKQVSYDEKRIAIPISATTEDDFTAGARIRIYNAGRSTMYQIDSVKRDGNQLWLTLDGTALVGMGKVGKVADGQLQLESFLDYANGTQRWNNFAGTWVGDDKSTKLVKGATHASNVSTIYLKSPVRAVALKKRFTGKMASVWQYGVRDKIELVRVESVGR